MVCLICYESLFKVQGSDGHLYYQESDSNEDLADRPAMLSCGHVYHKECIEEWFDLGTSCHACPMCHRRPARQPTVLYIDLEQRDIEHVLHANKTCDNKETVGGGYSDDDDGGKEHKEDDSVDDIVNQIYFLVHFCRGISSSQIIDVVKRVSLATDVIRENAGEMEKALKKESLANRKLEDLEMFVERDIARIGFIKEDLDKKDRRIKNIESRSNNIQRILSEARSKRILA